MDLSLKYLKELMITKSNDNPQHLFASTLLRVDPLSACIKHIPRINTNYCDEIENKGQGGEYDGLEHNTSIFNKVSDVNFSFQSASAKYRVDNECPRNRLQSNKVFIGGTRFAIVVHKTKTHHEFIVVQRF